MTAMLPGTGNWVILPDMMNETLQALRDFAATPMGRVVLGLAAIVALALLLVPLWRSLQYLFKALLWGLLVLAVLALAGLAVWFFMERESPDPKRREAFRREAAELVQQGIGTNFGKLFPANGGANDGR